MRVHHIRKRIPGEPDYSQPCRMACIADQRRIVDADNLREQFRRDEHDGSEEKPLEDGYARGEADKPFYRRGVALSMVDGLHRLKGNAHAVEEEGKSDHEEHDGRDRQDVRTPCANQVLGGHEEQKRLEKPGRSVAEAQRKRADEIPRQELRGEAYPAISAEQESRQDHRHARHIGDCRAERDSPHAKRRQAPLPGAEPVGKSQVHDHLRTV